MYCCVSWFKLSDWCLYFVMYVLNVAHHYIVHDKYNETDCLFVGYMTRFFVDFCYKLLYVLNGY